MDGPGVFWRAEERAGGARLFLLVAIGLFFSGLIGATSIIPISDRELLSRADVVVRGVVVSNAVSEDSQGRPETVTVISPLEVLKGEVSGSFVIRELGGELSDGRFFQLWGRPEYKPGHEVVVFALARPGGDYQTAELLLGKFEVQVDDAGQLFAVPSLTADAPSGVTVSSSAANDGPLVDSAAPRDLEAFLRMIRPTSLHTPTVPSTPAEPNGKLRSVIHAEYLSHAVQPYWTNIGGLWRWINGATAVFTLDGVANMTGGGVAEANNATATWDAEASSVIGYSVGTSTANPIHMNAPSSPCGWSSCLSGGGVIGCGGFGGGGTNVWRGETYNTITSGEVWLRSICATNGFDSTTIQSVLTHELGHTLGLGHSDQGTSAHDTCPGDESLAIMRSVVQSRTTLGTDDQDAVRWLYGDGGNSCTASNPPTVTTGTASGAGQAVATLNGTVDPNGKSTTAYFQYGVSSNYGTTTAQQALGSGTASISVSASLSGLSCGTVYHFRAVGTNPDGTGSGSDMVLTTGACAPPPPTVATSVASGISQTAATLAGTVDPNGTSTTAFFQYGTTVAYGFATASQSAGSGTSAVTIRQALTGLLCATPYHFRLVATTANGTTYGADQAFTTSACSATSFYTVPPCRLIDTRNPVGALAGPALNAGAARSFTIVGQCGLPAGAKAVSVNVTVVPATAGSGFLTLFPGGTSLPMASTINYKAGKSRANSALLTLGSAGDFLVWCGQISGTTDMVLDVNGYFQ